MKIVSREAGWLDYALSSLAAILAVYSTSMGINQPKVGYFFAIGILFGSLVSFGVARALRDRPLIKFDGFFYAILAITAIFFTRWLNGLLPEGGYGPQLMIGGLLSWMLMLGSFATWRDYSLLFQAVPSIALFGLGGVWDTFKGTTVLFFGFLLCTATLFARAHARAMLSQALDTGLFGASPSNRNRIDETEHENSAAAELSQGAWRWMAGPEWALASAAAIVIVSLVGAPLFQASLQNVAGVVRITTPAPTTSANTSRNFSSGRNSLSIGEGPRRLRGIELMRLKIDRPRYMRGTVFDTYTSGGWTREYSRYFKNGSASVRWIDERTSSRLYNPLDMIKNFEEVPFELTVLVGAHDKFYVPGEPYRMPTDKSYRVLIDGTVSPSTLLEFNKTYAGSAIAPSESAKPVHAGNPLAYMNDWVPATTGDAPFVDASQVPKRVAELAIEAAKGANTDFDKAIAIKRAIEGRVTYNLDAKPTPAGKDPVEHFLFDSKEGYCDLFASSMALMARANGLPARVVTGFIVTNGKRDENGFFTLRDSDYHAWAEIYFEDVGWIPFDPTEGAAGVGSLPSDNSPWYQRAWFRIALDVAIGLCVAIGLFFLFRPMFAKKPSATKQARSEVAKVYARFQRMVEKRAGFPRRLSYTPKEFILKAADGLGPAAPQALLLTDAFEKAFYAPVPPDADQLRALQDKLKEIRAIPSSKRTSER